MENVVNNPALMQLVTEIRFYFRQTATNNIEVGRRLVQAKELVPLGEWTNWLKDNFALSASTARRYMGIWHRFGTKTEMVQKLSPGQLIELLSLPAGEEEQFIDEKSAEGTPVEDMRIKKLREEVKAWKSRAEQAEYEKQGYKDALGIAEGQLDTLDADNAKLRLACGAASERNDALLAENADLQDDKDALSVKVKRLEKQIEHVPVKVVHPSDYEQLKDENAALKDENAHLKDEIAQLKADLATQMAALTAAIEKLTGKSAEQMAENPNETEQPVADETATEQPVAGTDNDTATEDADTVDVKNLEVFFNSADMLLNATNLIKAVKTLCEKNPTGFDTQLARVKNMCVELENCLKIVMERAENGDWI